MIFRFITTALWALSLLAGITHATPVPSPGDHSLRRDLYMGTTYWNGAAGLVVDTKYSGYGPATGMTGSFILPLTSTPPDARMSYSNASFSVLYGGDRFGTHATDPCGTSATVGAGVDMHINSDGTASYSAWSYLWDGMDQVDWIDDQQDFPFEVKGGDEIFINVTKLSLNSASVGMVNKRTGQLFETTHTNIRKGLCQTHVMWLVQEWADAVDKGLRIANFGEVVFRDLRWVTADQLSWYPSDDDTGIGRDYWVWFGEKGDLTDGVHGWWIEGIQDKGVLKEGN
ncbi:hypothetical protein B0T21DRAFT_353352 [Apiosordaria backusii]|uniref:Uncharacterized protein n=1 Tax=Apiosordaria backusii TaxID=314023 RepID=A0AA40DK78_9PEZI|nr:hypothetical protein B0T21DRAFT_353352 [Apiosordaria backusii]